MNKDDITQEVVKELLEYNPETGELKWEERGRKWFSSDRLYKTWNTKHAGKIGGITRVNHYGYRYREITLVNRKYRAHRVIWLYMTGEWPDGDIDHIDRDATNNKWDNIRQATRKQNNRNISMKKNNTSGVTGVYWRGKTKRWVAYVRINGKQHHLGSFKEEDIDLAAMEVLEFRAEHGFHPTHGLFKTPYYEES